MDSELGGDRSQSPEPCCHSPIGGPWWCSACDVQLCDACWEKQAAHSSKARNSGNHRKTELALAKIIKSILDPEEDEDEQIKLYEENFKTKWFGVLIKQESLTFYDFGQYSRLVVGMGRMDNMSLQYPSLSSFVGETGSGKSTLISALIKIKATRDSAQAPNPIMGTKMSTRPMSGEVHLFADPLTYTERRPIFYADCEGFSGGNDPPMTSLEEKRAHAAMAWATARRISWATGEQCSRQWIVENLYPRVLFTFSDTICFITRNLRVIEDVFCKLVIWADKAFDKSINQPILPHAIIIVNAVEVRVYKDTDNIWDVDSFTRSQLEDHKYCFQNNPRLSNIKDNWRKLGANIETLNDLLNLYYGDIKIVCVPHGRLPSAMINIQYSRLYDALINSSSTAMDLRNESGLLMTSNELGFYLHNAFDHFSRSGTEPFNFLTAAVRLHPIAQKFKDHILKVAVLLLALYPSWNGTEIFARISRLVASSIFLDTKRKHYPQQRLFAKYEPSCAAAQSEFYRSYIPCDYQDSRSRRCVNVSTGHAKGHQLANGRVFSSGRYTSPFVRDIMSEKNAFLDVARREFDSLKEKFRLKIQGNGDRVAHISDAAIFHREEGLAPFIREYIRDTESLESHKTCFGCLFETPVHVLYCGHVLCRRCITDFGVLSGHEVKITTCPLCPHSDQPWAVPWTLQLIPPYSGLRILSLDGGGVRGIVQLTILEILEERIDLGMPIQRFFDLIVGTSAGGMVALALGSNLLPVKQCKNIFRTLCAQAFTKRFLAGIPVVKTIVKSNHHSIYKTEELEKALKDVFAQKPIFGGKQGRSPTEVKVGVTSTSSSGLPYLHANYNRAQSKEDTRYVFFRGDNRKEELQVWEAARASSAAPTYFRSFFDNKTGHTFTDGALCYNNPVQVADTERRLLWPHLSHEPPALLLSIGTGYDSTTRSEARQSPRIQPGPLGYVRHLFRIAWSQLQTSLDCEKAWKDFIHPLDLREQDDLQKYCRLNQDYRDRLPRLDDVDKMAFLEESTRACFMQNKLIDQVADTLFASLFYFKLNSTRREEGSETRWFCQGKILCQLPAGSDPIKKLVLKLRRLKSNSAATMFILKERPASERAIPFPSDEFLVDVENGGPFELNVDLSIYEGEPSKIYLQLFGEGRSLIGGFPRSIVEGRYPHAEENRSWTL